MAHGLVLAGGMACLPSTHLRCRCTPPGADVHMYTSCQGSESGSGMAVVICGREQSSSTLYGWLGLPVLALLNC
jgi:hypothetical protein